MARLPLFGDDGYGKELGECPVLDALLGLLEASNDLAFDRTKAVRGGNGLNGLVIGALKVGGHSQVVHCEQTTKITRLCKSFKE